MLFEPRTRIARPTVFAVTSRVGDKIVVFDGDEGVAPSDLASWDELTQLKQAGWEIGRHAQVRWHWVKGHETGAAHAHKALNDRADQLAVAASHAAA